VRPEGILTRSRPRQRSLLGCSLATALTLLAALALASCGHSLSEADLLRSLAPTPGPPLTARPGAHVWVVGDSRLAFASADGGATWTTSHPESGEPDPPLFRSVAFSDTEHGWAVGFDTIITTSDGGRTWTTRRLATGSLRAVACSDARHVWAVGSQGDGNLALVLASNDGGATWEKQHIPAPCNLGAVAFADSRHGWILGEDSNAFQDVILATVDGGAHWHVQCRSARGMQLDGVAFSDARHGWVVGGDTVSPSASNCQPAFILATSDGGAHWRTQLAGTATNHLLGVAVADDRRGWAVGAGGAILATRNGGKTWVTQHSGAGNRNLGHVTFSDATHGWAVVDKWGLLATENGGQTWTVVLPGGPGHMVWDVAALEASHSK
jgi:photosystem II stability/assembly factor-like uncharacterized protein